MNTANNARNSSKDQLDLVAATLRSLAVAPGEAVRNRVFDRVAVIEGPIGSCFVVQSAAGIRHVVLGSVFDEDLATFIASYGEKFHRPLLQSGGVTSNIARALVQGKLQRGVVLDLSPLTDFERAVLQKTLEIPRGEVRPYAWVAREIGTPRAVRAVGSALARNPVPFIVPCHRVVRSDGVIGNYAFGTANKVTLLSDEGVPMSGTSTAPSSRFVGSDTTKIVCYPTCRAAQRITSAHRIGFSSLRAAASAGFRSCELCRPVQ